MLPRSLRFHLTSRVPIESIFLTLVNTVLSCLLNWVGIISAFALCYQFLSRDSEFLASWQRFNLHCCSCILIALRNIRPMSLSHVPLPSSYPPSYPQRITAACLLHKQIPLHTYFYLKIICDYPFQRPGNSCCSLQLLLSLTGHNHGQQNLL